jgi:hypothetical protein
MSTKTKPSLSELENWIRQLVQQQNIWATWKLWLLWADIHNRDLWKYGRYGSFVNYMGIT